MINTHFSKLDINNEIYVVDDFNFNFDLNNSFCSKN